jgi:hypothetical protein
MAVQWNVTARAGALLLLLGVAPGCLRISYDRCASDPNFHADCRDARAGTDGGPDASDPSDASSRDAGASADGDQDMPDAGG